MNMDEKTLPVRQEICLMRITFAVLDEHKAIDYKKQIAEVLSSMPNVRIDFSLMDMPTKPMSNAIMPTE